MKIPKTIILTLLIPLLTSLSHGNSNRNKWEVKNHQGHQYVPLNLVKKYYRMHTLAKSGRYLVMKNKEVTIKFKPGGQEVLMNGVKFIFSKAIISLQGKYHISTTDLTKIVNPVLFPTSIKEAKVFDTVIIDPGHGGKDAGAVNSLGTEADYNLKVARYLQANLKKRGFKVVMTRNSDRFLSLKQRVDIANRYSNAIFISIHFNAAGSRGRSSARGIETFTLSPVGVAHYGRGLKNSDWISRSGNAQDSANIALATSVHWSAIKRLRKGVYPSIADRGIRRARYSVLTGLKHPGLLFEGGFLSHPTERRYIHKASYQHALGEAIGDAIFFYRKATVGKTRRITR